MKVHGNDGDSVFLLINQTASTTTIVYSLMTFSKALAIDRDDITDLVVGAGDDIVIQQIGNDGSTEFSDVNLVLELEL